MTTNFDLIEAQRVALLVLDEEFERVARNVANGHVTHALASLLFEHFARGQENLLNQLAQASGSTKHVGLPYYDYCLRLNPQHRESMSSYRNGRPSDLRTH